MENRWTMAMVRMYNRYHEHGRTPNAGGDYDQSAVFMEAMDVLDKAYASGRKYEG
jgi:hypothetical protein